MDEARSRTVRDAEYRVRRSVGSVGVAEGGKRDGVVDGLRRGVGVRVWDNGRPSGDQTIKGHGQASIHNGDPNLFSNITSCPFSASDELRRPSRHYR